MLWLDVSDYERAVQRAVTLRLDDAGDPRWSRTLRELLPGPDAIAGFVAWAQEHPKWRFNVADVSAGVCAKPVEAAIAILSDIVAECLDDDAF